MAIWMSFSAAKARLEYLRDNASVMYLANAGNLNHGQIVSANGNLLSANVSASDFSIASGGSGPVLTVGSKTAQAIEGSGTVSHLYLTNGSDIIYVTTVSAQVLTSGNTANINSHTVSALQSANNA